VQALKQYEFPKVPRDPKYLGAILARNLLGYRGHTLYRDRIRVYFDRELSPDEVSRLRGLVESDPVAPVVYEFGSLDPADEVERIVGVRPVIAEWDPTRKTGRFVFEAPLTRTQEGFLEEAVKRIVSGYLRRVK